MIQFQKIPSELSQWIYSVDLKNQNASTHDECLKLGEIWKTQKTAVNVVRLAPHTRSSIPHAESSEEEFFFVVQGNPHVWLNGEVYPLHEGHCVGFPAGTGLCHTVINDSDKEAILLVLGEKSKAGNKWIYPLNPELKEAQGTNWWDEWPAQKIGSHLGDPHLSDLDLTMSIGSSTHSTFTHIQSLSSRGTFSYPQSTETFGEASCISDILKMKFLGINHVFLSTNKRSSWPHAHSHEEEFVFILKGNPHVWLNGWLHELKAGDLVFFAPHVAHALINLNPDNAEYLVWGQHESIWPEDKIYYPLHSQRNEECKKQNFYWDHFNPNHPMGPYPCDAGALKNV